MSSNDLINKQIVTLQEEVNVLRKVLNLPLRDFNSTSTGSSQQKPDTNGNSSDSFKLDVSNKLNLQVVPFMDEKAVKAALPYDDNFYLTFGDNGTMALRKKTNQKVEKDLTSIHSSDIKVAKYSKDKTLFLTGCDKRIIGIWDTKTLELICKFQVDHEHWSLKDADFMSNNKVVTITERKLTIWNVATKKVLYEKDAPFSPADYRAVAGISDEKFVLGTNRTTFIVEYTNEMIENEEDPFVIKKLESLCAEQILRISDNIFAFAYSKLVLLDVETYEEVFSINSSNYFKAISLFADNVLMAAEAQDVSIFELSDKLNRLKLVQKVTVDDHAIVTSRASKTSIVCGYNYKGFSVIKIK